MAKKRKRFVGRVIKKNPHQINEEIEVTHVRIVGANADNTIVETSEALNRAYAEGLDLVLLSPNAEPPVAKIMDYKKFLYEQKKKQKEIKANAAVTAVKEVRFGPNTDEHDYAFKLKNARSFLEDGAKVKAYVFFRGRTIVFKERGEELLNRLIEDLTEDDFAKVEQTPKMEGKRMSIFLAPNKIKK